MNIIYYSRICILIAREMIWFSTFYLKFFHSISTNKNTNTAELFGYTFKSLEN